MKINIISMESITLLSCNNISGSTKKTDNAMNKFVWYCRRLGYSLTLYKKIYSFTHSYLYAIFGTIAVSFLYFFRVFLNGFQFHFYWITIWMASSAWICTFALLLFVWKCIIRSQLTSCFVLSKELFSREKNRNFLLFLFEWTKLKKNVIWLLFRWR